MTPGKLTGERMLAAWERGIDLAGHERAGAVLAVLGGDASVASPTIGARDALLYRVRAESFGPTLPIRADCPACVRAVDAAVEIADVVAPGAAVAAADERRRIEVDGWHVTYRLPTVDDMAIAARASDAAAARAALVDACVLTATEDGGERPASALPPAAIDSLAAGIEAWDPLVETAMAIECPGCGHAWHAVLEIGGFLYAEIADAAVRIVRDVDELARRYGWREADILAMSGARRAMYIEQGAQAA